MNSVKLRNAEKKDTGLILRFIKAIAEYEHMSDDVIADEALKAAAVVLNGTALTGISQV